MASPVRRSAREAAVFEWRDAPRPIGSKCDVACVRPGPTTNQAHCSVCHATFGSVGGFDRHRSDGRCLNAADLGMVERDGVWRTPMDPDRLQRLRQAGEST